MSDHRHAARSRRYLAGPWDRIFSERPELSPPGYETAKAALVMHQLGKAVVAAVLEQSKSKGKGKGGHG